MPLPNQACAVGYQSAARLEGKLLAWPKTHFFTVESHSLCDNLLCTYCYPGAHFRQWSCCVPGICFLGPERLSSARAYSFLPLACCLLCYQVKLIQELQVWSKPIPTLAVLKLYFWISSPWKHFSLLKSEGSKVLPVLTAWTFKTWADVTMTLSIQMLYP